MTIKKKMRNNYLLMFFLSILTAIIFSSCQKVVNMELNDAEPQIVIEGLITDGPGPYCVTISKSGSYLDASDLPPVSCALVIITDNTGTIDTLKEKKPGIYFTSVIRGMPGRKYTLKVLSENKEYEGSSIMHDHVIVDSLKIVNRQSQNFGFSGGSLNDEYVELHCFFKDPLEKNFYRIRVFKNGYTNNTKYKLYDDQYSNGQEIDLWVSNAKAGDIAMIELFSLDNQTYEYYRMLDDLVHTNPFFGSTPANPNTNLNNRALGYFGACAVSFKTIIITDSLVNMVK